MLRREFLKTASVFALPNLPRVRDYGWLPSNTEAPGFHETFPASVNTGVGRVVLLYKYIEKILGKSLPSHLQTGPDCTSHAGSLSLDCIQAIESILARKQWLSQVATEPMHYGARQVIGGRRSGGVMISEFVKFATEYGMLFRQKYNGADYRKYNYQNTKPLTKSQLKECKTHQLYKAVKVTSWNEARDAIRNLNPIVIGSDVGFNNAKRDKEGFAKPRGTWYHAWALIGIDDRYKRPGGCLMNSHGENWISGPRRNQQPQGSIWVDKDVLDRMLSKYGDCYALCSLKGFQRSRYHLW